MKISLYLMSQKGHEVLKTIQEQNLLEVVDCVITSRDKKVENDYFQEIKELCENAGIKNYNREDKFTPETPYSIAVSWRWLIHNAKSTLIILHDSLLPKYRGFAPLVNMLINKEKKVGVTAIFADESYDTGSVIYQSSSEINYPITIREAIDIVSENYKECILYILRTLKAGEELPHAPQNEDEATYSLWRDEDDYQINWDQSSGQICTFIDAVSAPYAGASTFAEGRKVRILKAEPYPDVKIENRTPGKVIFISEEKPVVVCGSGLLKIHNLVADESRESLLPLKNFRTRFASHGL